MGTAIDCLSTLLAVLVLLSFLWAVATAASVAYPDVFGPPVVAQDVPLTAASLSHYYAPSPPVA